MSGLTSDERNVSWRVSLARLKRVLVSLCHRGGSETLDGGKRLRPGRGGTSALLVGSDGETRVTFGFKALMKGSIFADAAVFVLLPCRCFSHHLGSNVRRVVVSQRFSVNGTRQNKDLKMHRCWCEMLNMHIVYVLIYKGNALILYQLEKEFHYLSGCFIVLNNHPSYLLKQFYTS